MTTECCTTDPTPTATRPQLERGARHRDQRRRPSRLIAIACEGARRLGNTIVLLDSLIVMELSHECDLGFLWMKGACTVHVDGKAVRS